MKEQHVQPKDRKLGDEWSDWEGETGSREREADENRSTFLILASVIFCLISALFLVGWYLIQPRIEQLNPSVSNLFKWSLIGSAALFSVLIVMEGVLLLRFRKSLLPLTWVEHFLLFLFPKTVWLGKKFGISRDRVGNSFIKVHNLAVKSCADTMNLDRVLFLLPRCLKKDVRDQIISRINGHGKIVTAGGGEEAREAIRQYRPTLILALACERDLMSGIRDVAERVPVLAIPNKRPEGPCKNTFVSLGDLEEALTFIACKKNKAIHEGRS